MRAGMGDQVIKSIHRLAGLFFTGRAHRDEWRRKTWMVLRARLAESGT
jgi:hypothetical protein